MVGGFLLACVVALSPGDEPGDRHVTRGAISEAVAYHVRTTDPRVQGWIRTGAADSQTFWNLLTILGESDLIVHVQAVDRLSTAGQTYFVTSTPTVRYVRVEVVAGGNANEMIALIGHELQHAVEIALESRIRDRQALSQFYRGLSGNSTAKTEYDSVAARVAEDRVRREIAGAARSDSRPHSETLIAERKRD